MANDTVKCPACSHSWPASEAGLGLQKCPSCSEAGLGLQKCPSCGADLEVTRVVAWSYEVVVVPTTPSRLRLLRGGRGDPPGA